MRQIVSLTVHRYRTALTKSRLSIPLFCCEHIFLEDEDFFSNLLKNAVGQNSFCYATNDHAINLLTDWIKTRHKLEELPTTICFCLRFFMRATSEFISDWALDKWECPPRDMAKFFIAAMPEPLKPLLLQI